MKPKDQGDLTASKPSDNDLLTVVITAHARPVELMNAFQSCVAAGIQHIVVTATGISTEMRIAFSKLMRLNVDKVILEHPEGTSSNTSWLAGVREVKTPYVLILHDDDLLLMGILDRVIPHLRNGVPLVMWAARFHDANTGTILNALKLTGGIHKGRVILNFLLKRSRSISPGNGCYLKEVAEASLAESEENQSGQEYRARPDFVVGNDMLLWFRAAESSPTFAFIEEPCVSFGCAKSITHESCTAGGALLDNLMRFYDQTRTYWLKHKKLPRASRLLLEKPKICLPCYIPPETYPGLERFLRNVLEFRPEYDVIFYSDQKHRLVPKGTIRIPDCKAPHKVPPGWRPGDAIGTMAWGWGLRLALAYSYDYVIYLETDCRANCSGWDAQLMQEYYEWPGEAVCGGAPVCWHPWWHGEAWSRRLIQYAFDYQKKSGVAMAFEGDTGPQPYLYPNGALAVYDLAEMDYIFDTGLANPTRNWESMFVFDLAVGKSLLKLYGAGVFDKVAALTKVYSGCGDRHVKESRRLEMLRNHEKVAVHQIKRTDI